MRLLRHDARHLKPSRSGENLTPLKRCAAHRRPSSNFIQQPYRQDTAFLIRWRARQRERFEKMRDLRNDGLDGWFRWRANRNAKAPHVRTSTWIRCALARKHAQLASRLGQGHDSFDVRLDRWRRWKQACKHAGGKSILNSRIRSGSRLRKVLDWRRSTAPASSLTIARMERRAALKVKSTSRNARRAGNENTNSREKFSSCPGADDVRPASKKIVERRGNDRRNPQVKPSFPASSPPWRLKRSFGLKPARA